LACDKRLVPHLSANIRAASLANVLLYLRIRSGFIVSQKSSTEKQKWSKRESIVRDPGEVIRTNEEITNKIKNFHHR